MKIKYANLTLRPAGKIRLAQINEIIKEYSAQGYRLTLRQLYYQLVSRDIIANAQSEYARLSDILVQGRMAGIVDWEAIEDRLRVPDIPYMADGPADALDTIIGAYREDRMAEQPNYIEVIVEKDALSGVLKRVTRDYGIRLTVNRGYSSCTAMHDLALRCSREGRPCHILYLGDHDPSGMDMVRDITDRLRVFQVEPTVHRVALTTEQVEEHAPPPNPAKVTDPRAGAYIARFGPTSWEVDALPPETLDSLLREAVDDLVDHDLLAEASAREAANLARLKQVRDGFTV